MNVLIFFRSNHISAAISNSAKTKIENEKIENLNISIANIEKINIKKYFSKMEVLPDVIYIFVSENEIISWLKENYPNITYFIYNKDNYVFYENHKYGDSRKYSLNSAIIHYFKDGLQKKLFWIVNIYTLTIRKEELDDIDLKSLNIGECEFESEELANDCLKSEIEKKIRNCSDNINYYKKEIAKNMQEKLLLEKRLRKFD